jgi:hypothetical protein
MIVGTVYASEYSVNYSEVPKLGLLASTLTHSYDSAELSQLSCGVLIETEPTQPTNQPTILDETGGLPFYN